MTRKTEEEFLGIEDHRRIGEEVGYDFGEICETRDGFTMDRVCEFSGTPYIVTLELPCAVGNGPYANLIARVTVDAGEEDPRALMQDLGVLEIKHWELKEYGIVGDNWREGEEIGFEYNLDVESLSDYERFVRIFNDL